MSDQYIGEIRLFAGVTSRVPAGWCLCDGRELPIQQYEALYSLIGTIYGGNGATTFNLPDLRGRIPVGAGQGAQLTSRTIGQAFGSNTVSLTANQMAAHSHTVVAVTTAATTDSPNGTVLAQPDVTDAKLYSGVDSTHTLATMAPAVSTVGEGMPHENVMPYLAMNYMIAWQGNYPDLQ